MSLIAHASNFQVVPANASCYTGTVFQSMLSSPSESSGIQVVRVTFAPTARTFWHSHPAGQVLYVESGVCQFQSWGSEIVDLKPGDTATIPANEKHWHGASRLTVMTHLEIQATVDGNEATWLEPVSVEQYLSQPAA